MGEARHFKFDVLIQVVQQSLTNPREALHYDKQQNFKTVT